MESVCVKGWVGAGGGLLKENLCVSDYIELLILIFFKSNIEKITPLFSKKYFTT